MASFGTELATYLRAKYPLTYVVTNEERRVEREAAAVAASLGYETWLWSCVSGFTSPDGQELNAANDPLQALGIIKDAKRRVLYILRDYHPFLDVRTNPANAVGVRALRELARSLRSAPREEARAVLFIAPVLVVPEELRTDVAVLEWALPTRAELRAAVVEITSALPPDVAANVTPETTDDVADGGVGLTLEEASDSVARSLVATRGLDRSIVSREKKQAVARGGLLEWVEPSESLSSVGGYAALKSWLLEREKAFSPEARAFGLPEPKGVLCVGVPGCGKSLLAKAVATAWRRPLLRLDVGRLFGALVGQSESQLRAALKTAEACAPCVLWLDEVEKAFAGMGSGAADGGTSTRVFGGFLTWMQERRSPAPFVFATANDVSSLPPELLRKGRFDDVFFVDLPTPDERRDVWTAQFARYKQAVPADMSDLVGKSDGFSGAEIEAALVAAMFTAFASGSPLNATHVMGELAQTVPLSKTAAEKIDALRAWAKGRARNASSTVAAGTSRRTLEL